MPLSEEEINERKSSIFFDSPDDEIKSVLEILTATLKMGLCLGPEFSNNL